MGEARALTMIQRVMAKVEAKATIMVRGIERCTPKRV
jgi:hypothetical protein